MAMLDALEAERAASGMKATPVGDSGFVCESPSEKPEPKSTDEPAP
jgi:hypothetical protein